MNIKSVVSQVPDELCYLTLGQLSQRTQRLLEAFPGKLRKTVVGKSRYGRDIAMLSIGEGPHSVLVVGAPHPHELIGTMTIDFLVNLFCNAPSILEGTGASWHFITVIDPDGVDLNAGWLDKPLSVTRYFSSFFRPPLWRQAEFTFPFSTSDHQFSASTAENLAWIAAMDLVKPDLLYSTHNCEFEKVFYFTSAGLPALDRALSDMTSTYQMKVDAVGEYGALPKGDVEGVFSYPDEIQESIRDGRRDGEPTVLRTGDSSAGYSERKFGTFSLVAEVPYWRMNERAAGVRIDEILEKTILLETGSKKLIDQYLPILQRLQSDKAVLLLEAIEATRTTSGVVKAATGDCVHGAVGNYLLALRPLSMLLQLTEIACTAESIAGAAEMFSVVSKFHQQCLATLIKPDILDPIPIRKLVQMQTEAVLLALSHIKSVV